MFVLTFHFFISETTWGKEIYIHWHKRKLKSKSARDFSGQGEGDERLGEGEGGEEVFEITMEAFFILNVIKTWNQKLCVITFTDAEGT